MNAVANLALERESRVGTIAFIDLKAQQKRIRERVEKRLIDVLDHGRYIAGPEIEEMEALLSAVKLEVARPSWEPDDVIKVARDLAGDESPTARRLAVDLLAQAGMRTRWNETCRELLEQLRRDDYSGVAERAGLLVTRPEP